MQLPAIESKDQRGSNVLETCSSIENLRRRMREKEPDDELIRESFKYVLSATEVRETPIAELRRRWHEAYPHGFQSAIELQ